MTMASGYDSGHHLEKVLPGMTVLDREELAGDGNQSSVERVLVVLPGGERRRLVVRSPRAGALGMDASEDCARRVLALYRTRGLPYCPATHAVWGVDGSGKVIDPRDIRYWYVAETAVSGVPLVTLLAEPDPGRDLADVFERLGKQLAELHATPERPAGLSPSRGVYESLAGPEGAMPILADCPADELRAEATFVHGYVVLVARLAWSLESDEDRPTASCHGDLHPGNILVDHAGPLGFIDRSRTETCEPASDIASVLVNLIRLGIRPASDRIDHAALTDAFLTSYDRGARKDWVRPLGYYLLTRMPAAVASTFNPTVNAETRWRALRWIHDVVAAGPPETVDGWLGAVRSITRDGKGGDPDGP
jgi:aminoglycoside phosphotransferase (APT) family kinase protein